MIDFRTENKELPSLDYSLVEKWIIEVGLSYDRKVRNLTYIFCDDEYILDTNRKFLNHDYYTDIITFDYSRLDKISGDMVISLETVASNAESSGVPYIRELLRVIIHGVLHLCGINDKGPGEREIMEAAEDKALVLYDELQKTSAD